jgi:hypothetical protein
MTAKLMSRSVCFEPISKSALYQGTTSVVPKRASRTRALAPAALFPSQLGFGSVRQLNREEDITFAAFIKPDSLQRGSVRAEARTLPARTYVGVRGKDTADPSAPLRFGRDDKGKGGASIRFRGQRGAHCRSLHFASTQPRLVGWGEDREARACGAGFGIGDGV